MKISTSPSLWNHSSQIRKTRFEIGQALWTSLELSASLAAPSRSRFWLTADAFEKLRYSKVIYSFVVATFFPINLTHREEGAKVYSLCMCTRCVYVCGVCVCVVSIMCMHICEFARTWPTNRRRILRSIFYPAWKRYGERERRIKYSRRSRWQPKVARKLNWRTPRHESGAFDRKNSSTTLWFPFCRVRAIGGLLERF